MTTDTRASFSVTDTYQSQQEKKNKQTNKTTNKSVDSVGKILKSMPI